MLPNFNELNQWIKNCQINPMDVKLSSIISQFSSIARMANSLPEEYARLYSVIQQIKYATDGTPTDVTPENNKSVAESVPATYLQRVKDAALALKQMQDEFDATKSNLDFRFESDFNFYRRNEFVIYSNSDAITVRRSNYVIPNRIRGAYYKRSWKINDVTYNNCFVRAIAWLYSKWNDSLVGVVTEIFQPYETKYKRKIFLYMGRFTLIDREEAVQVNSGYVDIGSMNPGQSEYLTNRDDNSLVFSSSNTVVGLVATRDGGQDIYTIQQTGSVTSLNLTQNLVSADGLDLDTNKSYIPATTGVSFVNYDVQPLISIIENL